MLVDKLLTMTTTQKFPPLEGGHVEGGTARLVIVHVNEQGAGAGGHVLLQQTHGRSLAALIRAALRMCLTFAIVLLSSVMDI